jgi:DNA polymerase-3 subunit delta
MLPMMAPRRFLLVRSLDRWDAAAEKSATKEKSAGVSPMDRLVAYVQKPVESTCMVLTAAKLDRRRKLVAVAKKADFLVECEPLSREALPGFIKQEVAKRGHKMERGVADHLAEIAGPDLSAVVDAVERLSLYVGEGGTITEESVAICVTRIRPSSVWDLLGSIGRRDAARALAVLAEVYEPQDRGLRLVGLLSWSTRQLLRFILASRTGATPQEAAVAAGAPPFKAKELAGQAKNFNTAEIEQWLHVLAETDRLLKGSRRPPCAILESSILTMTVGLPK